MHGGVTALISAGELHLPGLPLPPDARTALSVAIVTKRCYDNLRPSGVKVHAGTLLLVPGLTEKDFDEIASLGIKLVKFIFYDYSLLPNGEAERYVSWAHARGIKVKIHSGGVSRSGVSQVARLGNREQNQTGHHRPHYRRADSDAGSGDDSHRQRDGIFCRDL